MFRDSLLTLHLLGHLFICMDQDVNVRLSTSSDIYSDENLDDLPRHKFSNIRFGDWNWTQVWETDFNVPQVHLHALK
jgi:hypothetical protein